MSTSRAMWPQNLNIDPHTIWYTMHLGTLSWMAQLMEVAFENSALISGICVDSRQASPNYLFFALSGEKTDGHNFLESAAQNGAIAAVVEQAYDGPSCGLQLIKVSNVLTALQMLTRKILEIRKPKIVGVTGSVGKTTTKDFIGTLLKKRFKIAVTPGNHNSQTGIPLAILNHTQGDEEILVIEMGMTHPGNISSLIKMAPPDVAVLTTIALVHAINFESEEEIAKAKAEIFSHPKTVLGIVNRDIAHFNLVIETGHCPKKTFSTHSLNADYVLVESKEYSIVRTSSGDSLIFENLKIPGKHNYQNLLAAIACARHFGLTWEEIKAGIELLVLPERRLEMINKNGTLFVNDSYNACELSVKAAFNSMPNPDPGGRKIAVLGEMLELGKFSDQCHHEVGEAALDTVDALVCMGKGCEPIHKLWKKYSRNIHWVQDRTETDRQQLVEHLRKLVRPGDVVLLKGSKANQLWKVLEEI